MGHSLGPNAELLAMPDLCRPHYADLTTLPSIVAQYVARNLMIARTGPTLKPHKIVARCGCPANPQLDVFSAIK